MNLLDWLLVVVVLAYALSGYWQGFVTGAFATAGLLLGGLLGIWLAPIALGNAEPSLLVSLGALFIVIVTASLGQAALQYAGARIRDTSPGSRSGPSTRSAALCSARSPCCWSPGRSGSRSPARAWAASPPWCASRPSWRGSTRRCPTAPASCCRRSTTWWARRSSPATSSRSLPSASSRSRPGRAGCSPTPTSSTPSRACSRCAAPTAVAAGSRAAASCTPTTG